MSMDPLRLVELVAAILILGAGVFLYRRKPAGPDEGNYGSQGAVILLVIAAIVGIHALGGLDYHPSESEMDYFKSRAQSQ